MSESQNASAVDSPRPAVISHETGYEGDTHPTVTVDGIVFTVDEEQLKVLLVRRQSDPFGGMWALPGGFVEMSEALDEAARRVLFSETGVKDIYLEQLYTFGEPGRDPRTRVITVVYYALVVSEHLTLEPKSDDATEAQWRPTMSPPPLAFDHQNVLDYAIARLRNKIGYTNIAFQLLPQTFTLTELQRVYEVILGHELDKRNFRKKIQSVNVLEKVEGTRREGPHRPAQLYKFTEKDDLSSELWPASHRDRCWLYNLGTQTPPADGVTTEGRPQRH